MLEGKHCNPGGKPEWGMAIYGEGAIALSLVGEATMNVGRK